MSELKACPFEKKKRHLLIANVVDSDGQECVYCKSCEISVPRKLWQARTLPPEVQAVMDAAEQWGKNQVVTIVSQWECELLDTLKDLKE